MSSEPKKVFPNEKWEHYKLYKHIKEAILSLPIYFRTDTIITGFSATDIFTLNSALGATIEDQVVYTLNQMRSIWDPDEKYTLYAFFRQTQTFPDVLLKKISADKGKEDIILGIELKGWYLLAKEGEPSLRFKVTPSACAVPDLLVVVPWALSNVISGHPKVFSPYIESARYAAEYRNYHWTNLREAKTDNKIEQPAKASPYPKKSDQILDRPTSDAGGNFGRVPRTGIMDDYLQRIKSEYLCGISAEHWLKFFKLFQEQSDEKTINSEIENLRRRIKEEEKKLDKEKINAMYKILEGITDLIK